MWTKLYWTNLHVRTGTSEETLNSDFQLLEAQENEFLLFKPTILIFYYGSSTEINTVMIYLILFESSLSLKLQTGTLTLLRIIKTKEKKYEELLCPLVFDSY